MNKTVSTLLGLVALTALVPFAGCGGSQQTRNGPDVAVSADAPNWVSSDAGAVDTDIGRIFYGVGVASDLKDETTALPLAENRARAKIASMFAVYASSLVSDFMAADEGDGVLPDDPESLEKAMQSLTGAALPGIVIVEHWADPAGTLFARAELDLEIFTNNLDKILEIDAKLREYVRKNAGAAHATLAERLADQRD